MNEDTQNRSDSVPKDGDAFPEHLIELIWSWFEYDGTHSAPRWEATRPSSRNQLASLVNAAFQASLQTEEGRPVRLHVLFDPIPKQVTVSQDSFVSTVKHLHLYRHGDRAAFP
jgi:hypothetical protein